jgi:hypothetical protein
MAFYEQRLFVAVRGGAFMSNLLAVLARLTLKKKLKKVSCLIFIVHWYSVHWNTAEPIR